MPGELHARRVPGERMRSSARTTPGLGRARDLHLRADRRRPIALPRARRGAAPGELAGRAGEHRALSGPRLRGRPRRPRGVGVGVAPLRVPQERRGGARVAPAGAAAPERHEAGPLRHALAPPPEPHRPERPRDRPRRGAGRARAGARCPRWVAGARFEALRGVRGRASRGPRGVARDARPGRAVGGGVRPHHPRRARLAPRARRGPRRPDRQRPRPRPAAARVPANSAPRGRNAPRFEGMARRLPG